MWHRLKTYSLLGAVLCLGCGMAPAATLTLAGFNQDLIAELGATNPTTGTSTAFSGWVFSERGASPDNANRGFLSTGIVSTTNQAGTVTGSTFQLASFTANNVLRVTVPDAPATRQLTFSLAQQTTYQDLQFLTTNQGGGGGTSWDAILVFSDGSTSLYSSVASGRQDWISLPSQSAQLRFNHQGLERRDGNWGVVGTDQTNYTGGLYLYEDSITLRAADQLKTLVGVQFDVTASGEGLAVFAINGTAIVPEPSLALLSWLGLGLLVWWRRR